MGIDQHRERPPFRPHSHHHGFVLLCPTVSRTHAATAEELDGLGTSFLGFLAKHPSHTPPSRHVCRRQLLHSGLPGDYFNGTIYKVTAPVQLT